jgi:hypothetical protein
LQVMAQQRFIFDDQQFHNALLRKTNISRRTTHSKARVSR